MNPSDRDRTLTTIIALAVRLHSGGEGQHKLPNAIRLLQASDVRDSALRSGMGASEGGHSTGGHTDPTGDTATRGLSSKAQATIDGIDSRLVAILERLSWVDLEVGKACRAPADPRPKQKPLEGCTSCHRDNGAWEPIDHRRPTGGLCRWCADFLTQYHRRPTLTLVQWHRQGKRISTKFIENEIGVTATEGLTVTAET